MSIPSEYRLLTRDDVGKIFGIDFELEVYFDTTKILDCEYTEWYYTNFIIGEQSIPSNNVENIKFTLENVVIYNDEWLYDSYTMTTGLEIETFDANEDWNNWFYVKEIKSPISIIMTSKDGIKLLTKDTKVERDIVITLDPSIISEDNIYEELNEMTFGEEVGYTLTLNCASNVLNSSYYTYSLDSGTTWNRFTSSTMTLENVEHIMFKTTNSTSSLYGLIVKVLNSSVYIAKLGHSETPSDIILSEDAAWYVEYARFPSHSGGAGA